MTHADITLVAALLCMGAAHADPLAFIGAPRAVQLSEKPCTEYLPPPAEGTEVLCMDRAFHLSYEVVQRLRGDVHTQTVDFVGFYHYWGMPSYTQYEPALVVLERVGDHLLLRKIENAEERDGDWWVCDEWPENEAEDCSKGRFVSEVIDEIIPDA